MKHILAAAMAASAIMIAAVAQAAPAVQPSAPIVPTFRLGQITAGYTYFNRPGADLARHDADLRACMIEAGKLRSADEIAGPVATGVIGALVSDMMIDMMSKGVRPSGLENCMVARGWRVVRVTDEEGARLAALPRPDLRATLAPWIGADTPQGAVARWWTNEAAKGTTERFVLRPAATSRGSLSVRAFEGSITLVDASLQTPGVATPLRQGRITPPLANMALVVFQVKGISMRGGNGLVFVRIDPESLAMLPGDAQNINIFAAATGSIAAKREGNWFAYYVPPGVWRLQAMVNGLIGLNFCLGAPAFEAKAGEIIYGGAFDLLGAELGPDMALEPARQWLSAAPIVAQAMKPAAYSNGWTGQCAGTEIYGLEFPGAPFRPGYEGGSRAGWWVAPPAAP